jgi:maltooligosyltrehalose trehalohydrolase
VLETEFPWERRLGATPIDDGLVEIRAWAPRAEHVAVRVGGADHALADEGFGVRVARVPARAGDDYWLVLDGRRLPDPWSRSQPRGLRGPSRIVDPRAFAWTDAGFRPPALRDLVVLELHVGTFTPEGTFDAAIEHLPALRELGITAIELMPVAEFPGARNWGYDGVFLTAAQSSYGGPLALQRLVDAAHAAGLAVLLDLVPNHVGASGVRALEAFGPFFTERYKTFWGPALNYDDADSDAVRAWLAQGAEWWVRDLHVDGLRLDAIHAVFDAGARHVVAELAARVHAARRGALVIAESGLNDPKVVRPERRGGLGCDAVWADDFHHALRTLLTGEREGYYDQFGAVADLAKAFRRPHVHDGTYSSFRRRRFGALAGDVPPERFVVFAMDHDQVGNRALGDRLPRAVRPLAAFCMLLSPFTPMLFMGEEYGEEAPFQFFTDHIDRRIAQATREGRRREFAAFAAFAGEQVPDPQDPETFERSKLTRRPDRRLQRLYADLLRVRRELPRGDVDAVAFDEDARWLTVDRGRFRLCANFARRPRDVPAPRGREVVLATHAAELRDGTVRLPARAGALIGPRSSASDGVDSKAASSFGALP